MVASTFELFKIGVGPSSSHTMGPMLAAAMFVERLADADQLDEVTRVETLLFGSLALTGKGHATDRAILLGLSGQRPEHIEPDAADLLVDEIRSCSEIRLNGSRSILFDEETDVIPAPRQGDPPGRPAAAQIRPRRRSDLRLRPAPARSRQWHGAARFRRRWTPVHGGDLLFRRRRGGAGRGPDWQQQSGKRPVGRALSLLLGCGPAADCCGRGAVDRRDHARQRANPAGGRSDQRRNSRDRGCHVRLYRSRDSAGWDSSGRCPPR